MNKIAKMIDHTALSACADKKDIETLCAEAQQYGFGAVCVNPCRVALAASVLKSSAVKVVTVVGFPLGATTIRAKCEEAAEAVASGADEIDMVMNIGKFKDGADAYVAEEIAKVKQSCGVTLKVIIETCLLGDDEIARAARIAAESGADYVKTSTGFSKGGATAEAVKIIKRNCGRAKIKAAGGIRDYQTALAMIAAGADRIGTSNGVAIVKEAAQADGE